MGDTTEYLSPKRSILWLWVDGPATKLPRFSPRASTIASHTRTFSTPLSTCIRDGQYPPLLWIALRNKDKTVSERLLLLQWRNIILLERPSMPPWITNPQRINAWWPSRCQSEFGQGIYFFLDTTTPHLIAEFLGCFFAPSVLRNASNHLYKTVLKSSRGDSYIQKL